MYTRGSGVFARGTYTGITLDPGSPLTPGFGPEQEDFFDVRTYAVSVGGGLAYQISRRWAFNAGAGAGTTYREHSSLTSVLTYGGQAGVSTRIGRDQSLGFSYTYGHFEYRRRFGFGEMHGVGVSYSRPLWFTRRWAFSAGVGVYRVHGTRLERVFIDPAIARLIGISTGLEVTDRVFRGTSMGVSIARSFQKSSVSFNYSRGFNPGSGLYLASESQSVGASYTYRGIRDWSLGLTARYGTGKALLQEIPPRHSASATAFASRRLTTYLHLGMSAAVRRAEIGNLHRDSWSVSLGLGFAPGEAPLAFW
jgi:hypothetical protein